MRALLLLPALVLIGVATAGCVRTVADIVTFPVKAVGQGVDWATTSQDEADRNYGRKMRKQEAREGERLRREEKARRKAQRRARERDEDRRD